MQIGPERISRRGLTVLVISAAAFAGLGAHGYLTRTATPSGSLLPSNSPSVSGPSATATGPSPSPSRGPKLSSTPYAQFAYEIYPAPPSAATRQALAGFQVSVTPQGTSLELTVKAVGGGGTIRHSYPAADRIYFVESNLGDDTATQEFNFGDDGVVVTDSAGFIVG